MTDSTSLDNAIERAAEVIARSEVLLIGAGAGMGVDSGLPDFRGNEGFWKAYPPFRGRRFAEVSNPVWFERDPAQAWGFFGHRLNLYRHTVPHTGFTILQQWSDRLGGDCFVFTSNVDGQFQKAGFDCDRIVECHGSIHYLQCTGPCSDQVWSAADLQLDVDEQTMRATSELPTCRECGAIARPNVLMFGDYAWLPHRWEAQQLRYTRWLAATQGQRRAIIEIGAGVAVPTVRYECQTQAGTLIRINPRDAQVPSSAVAIAAGHSTRYGVSTRCCTGPASDVILERSPPSSVLWRNEASTK